MYNFRDKKLTRLYSGLKKKLCKLSLIPDYFFIIQALPILTHPIIDVQCTIYRTDPQGKSIAIGFVCANVWRILESTQK